MLSAPNSSCKREFKFFDLMLVKQLTCKAAITKKTNVIAVFLFRNTEVSYRGIRSEWCLDFDSGDKITKLNVAEISPLARGEMKSSSIKVSAPLDCFIRTPIMDIQSIGTVFFFIFRKALLHIDTWHGFCLGRQVDQFLALLQIAQFHHPGASLRQLVYMHLRYNFHSYS